MSQFEHVLWDMDGVLLDSERHWDTGNKFFLASEIKSWDQFDQSRLVGRSLLDTYHIFKNEYNLQMSYQEYESKFNAAAREVYSKRANLMPHARDVLNELQATNIGQSIVSSSTHHWINMAVNRFNLKQYFSCIISAEDVNGRGKPVPDIYLFAQSKLNIPTEELLVVEDSIPGIQAALAAGLTVIGYAPMGTNNLHNYAVQVITDLREIPNIINRGSPV